ncbi:hypothetical protein GLOIN_2v1879797 [Rhizophagus clarus]|uniref:Uncharacterized protein n=1 Tax=Rhizophagus clarus TaxID=94130 RepID=A0A8H3QK07_9GLOM|nr:hypothetical protein GLOIN_2v1879797 [Rhizophagus clarus]
MSITKINNCCGCIPLKSGIVIITLLWLIYGVYGTVVNARYISAYKKYIAAIIIHGFVALGAAFGLYILAFEDTFKMLIIYSKITLFITAVVIIDNLTAIISIVSYDSPKECAYQYGNYGGCDMLIVITIISILLSVYFSIIILVYARRRKSKEYVAATVDNHPHGQTREDTTSVP